jgi:phage internal scaffolding protein
MSRKIKKAYTRTRVKTQIPEERKTKAVQSERKNSDINHIVAKAYKTGQLPVLMNRKPIEQMPDELTYQEALNKVVFAQQQFEQLPSAIRAEFENKPENMLAAISRSEKEPAVKAKLQEMGIMERPIPADLSAEQSPVGANGGEATAKPPRAPVEAPPKEETPKDA